MRELTQLLTTESPELQIGLSNDDLKRLRELANIKKPETINYAPLRFAQPKSIIPVLIKALADATTTSVTPNPASSATPARIS